MTKARDHRRELPSVDSLASQVLKCEPTLPLPLVVNQSRSELISLRRHLHCKCGLPSLQDIINTVLLKSCLLLSPKPRAVINATGVIVHTNLGRAPLSDRAMQAVKTATQSYSDLEYDLEDGGRGSRGAHTQDVLRELTGAEASLVVNNNAAAIFLGLAALARGGEVIVSRGEAVEIGGGFRIPEILEHSGGCLCDVGTTNRTRLADYETAIGPKTAMILRVHTSNFQVVGFTERVALDDLCHLGERNSIPVVNDVGSGTLLATDEFGLRAEPTVQQSVAAGAALTTFSGDKLLGGPQSGIIVGRKDLVESIANHPLHRILRPDKLCLAALHGTLLSYLNGTARDEIPVWQMIASSTEHLERRIAVWVKCLDDDFKTDLIQTADTVGGGSLPGNTIPSVALSITSPRSTPDQLAAALRKVTPPIIGKIESGSLLLAPRTVLEREDEMVATVLGSL